MTDMKNYSQQRRITITIRTINRQYTHTIICDNEYLKNYIEAHAL